LTRDKNLSIKNLTIKPNQMQKFYSDKIAKAIIIVLAMVILAACRKADSLKADASAERKATVAAALDAPAAKWVDSWAASFLSTKVNGVVQAAPSFNNQTFRLNIFSKLGGTRVRVKLTNKFGTNSLTVGAVHIALRSTNNSIVAASDRTLKFNGQAGVTLAPGAEIWSDSVTLTVAQHVTVAISVYVPGSFKPTTFHPTGLHTSYLSKTGNYVASTTLPLASFTNTTTQVVMVSGLQVWASPASEVAITFGDSITDGAAATNNANGNWPDILSNRLPALPSGAPFSVINMGIGSNRLVASDLAGPSGVHRFNDDVLLRPNVKYVILLEGINDISYHQASAKSITDAYATLVAQTHTAGIKVYGATLLPIGNSTKYTVANEATRQAVNTWIRTPGNFDAILDFEAIVRDTTKNPLRIKAGWTGDYVHPNAAGYAAIGNSIPLNLFN
jgi:lysophospholipase L1-like esterase